MLETPSLLITDDDRDLRETLRDAFEPRGFRTLLAADGAEAVEIVKSETVHLVLLDMHMPRMTGLEALWMVKSIRSLLPCILMSAALDDAITEEAHRAHAFSVQAKPVRFRELTALVKRALLQTYSWSPSGETYDRNESS